MPAAFITGVGTGIGKTLVTAALAHQLRALGRPVEALKPVVTGFDDDDFADSDPAILLAALGRPVTLLEVDRIAPFRFGAPLAPAMAAAEEGEVLDTGALIAFCEQRIAECPNLLIEGVGGVMVPLAGTTTVLDWMSALGLPCILVTGTYLGALSHTLTALEVMRSRGLGKPAVIVSESPGGIGLQGTIDALRSFGNEPFALPHIPGDVPWANAPQLTTLLG